MIELVFILVSLISLLFIMLLTKKFFTSILELNFFGIWLWIYVVFGYVGALLVLFNFANNSYFISPILYKTDIVSISVFMILWAGIGMFITFLINLYIYSNLTRRNINWNDNVLIKTKEHRNEIFYISIFSVLTIVSFIYYQLVIYPSPLILSIQGDFLASSLKRIEITRNLGQYANTYIIAFGMLLSQILSIQLIIRNDNGLYLKTLKLILLVVSVLFMLSNGEKAPVLFYGIALLVSWKIKNHKPIKINLFLILLAAISLIVVYYLSVSNDLNEIKDLIFERLFFAQTASVYYSLDFYSSSNFIGLSSLGGVFNKILGIEAEDISAVTLMKVYFDEMIQNGGWNINGIYIGESWANFGSLGVIFSPIYVGIICSILYIYLIRKNDSFHKSVLIYYSCCSFSFLTSINIYIYNSVFILLVIIYILRNIILALGNLNEKRHYS